MFPLRFRLRSLMILVIPAVGIGAWTYRVLPKCPVHGTVMWRGSVPIDYGLFRFGPSEVQYVRARTSLFPNCDDAALGGCVVQPEDTMPKNICRTCNATRNAWRLTQAKANANVSAFSAGPDAIIHGDALDP
jgi:hypothetical protein